MSSQKDKGRAFEYACAISLKNLYGLPEEAISCNVMSVQNKECFDSKINKNERQKYIAAATAGINVLNGLEPMLLENTNKLKIMFQPDSAGQTGDVRDILCNYDNEWEIGISCKHNHDALKHSRLSGTNDFGSNWLVDMPCSKEYLENVEKILGKFRGNKEIKWKDIRNKDEEFYTPVLKEFINELMRLDAEYQSKVASRFVQYMVGKKDFYKIIMKENRSATVVQAFNFNGTLNHSSPSKKASYTLPKTKLPKKFYNIGFKDNSKNTIVVLCDNGWEFSLRIHSAETFASPSLKLDVHLTAVPNSVFIQTQLWNI